MKEIRKGRQKKNRTIYKVKCHTCFWFYGLGNSLGRLMTNHGSVEGCQMESENARWRWIEGLNDDAVTALCRWCVWISAIANRAPYWRHQVVLGCFAVPYEASARFANTDSRTSQIILKTLVVLGKKEELELSHGLLVRLGIHLG
jgi:hypothetical protein